VSAASSFDSAVHGQRIVADEEMNMDKDRIKGAAKNTSGKMKEAAGKMDLAWWQ
jgi:hypothetical protein